MEGKRPILLLRSGDLILGFSDSNLRLRHFHNDAAVLLMCLQSFPGFQCCGGALQHPLGCSVSENAMAPPHFYSCRLPFVCISPVFNRRFCS